MSRTGRGSPAPVRSAHAGPAAPGTLDRTIKMRVALAVGLVIPLAFFVFLVVRFDEAWVLAGAGVLVYLYILAQFFIWQNPRRHARRAARDRQGAGVRPEERG